ncbi:MAG: hypothetical protein Q4A27_01480 [bacterium]|nr:hypothetical protein [bacterium]
MTKIQKTAIYFSSVVILTLLSFHNLAFAEAASENTAILKGMDINSILNLILLTLNAGAVVLATGSIAVAGFLYLTAANNASQVQRAKTMIFNTVIGIIAYVFMWTILEWLIPGGVF